MRRTVPILAVLFLAFAAAQAQQGAPQGLARGMGLHGGGPPPYHEHLFPPELVLSNQTAIGLTADQLAEVKAALKEAQAKSFDILLDLQRVTEKLDGILKPSKVDAQAALAAADEAMGLEAQVKRIHLATLIRVKNVLTEDQIAKLREMRPARRGHADE